MDKPTLVKAGDDARAVVGLVALDDDGTELSVQVVRYRKGPYKVALVTRLLAAKPDEDGVRKEYVTKSLDRMSAAVTRQVAELMVKAAQIVEEFEAERKRDEAAA